MLTYARCRLAMLVLLIAAPAWAVKSGDVVVIKQAANLKISGKMVGQVKAGDIRRVHGVRGAWVEVGDKPRGWVRLDNVLNEQEGLDHISKLLQDKPDDIQLWITRARMHLAVTALPEADVEPRLALAESDLLEALRQAPANAEIRYYQALVALRRNDLELAQQKLNEAIDLNDKDARFFAERGRLLERAEDKAGARRDYEQVAELDQADEIMYNNLAWWYATNTDAAARDGTKAIKYATEACKLTDYKNFMYVDTLAAAYAEANDFPNAIRWQEEAIKLCNDPIEKHRCEARLEMYRLNQAFRE